MPQRHQDSNVDKIWAKVRVHSMMAQVTNRTALMFYIVGGFVANICE